MATAAEIALVRVNTNEPTENPYTDLFVAGLVDDLGSVDAASAAVWRAKAAALSTLVDETEAGTSHKFSDLHKNALAMAKAFDTSDAAVTASAVASPRVRIIERS